MSENNKKTLPVMNQDPSSPKKVIRRRYKEIELGCGCGSGSCENCPGSLGIKAGSEKSVVYRNVFIYLTIAIVIFVGTYAVKVALTSLQI